MTRYRTRGVKREHGIVRDLLPVLERIADHPAVASVIPGRIRVTPSNTPGLKVRLQARTVSGFKLGARTTSLAQEVFVVTSQPEEVEAALVSAGLVEAR